MCIEEDSFYRHYILVGVLNPSLKHIHKALRWRFRCRIQHDFGLVELMLCKSEKNIFITLVFAFLLPLESSTKYGIGLVKPREPMEDHNLMMNLLFLLAILVIFSHGAMSFVNGMLM